MGCIWYFKFTKLPTHALVFKCNVTAKLHHQLVLVLATSFTSFAPSVTLALVTWFVDRLYFPNLFFHPGLDQAPCTVSHIQIKMTCEKGGYVFVLQIWIGISQSQIRYFWALDKVRKSGNWEDAADGHGFPRIYKFSFNLNGLFYFSGWQFF